MRTRWSRKDHLKTRTCTTDNLMEQEHKLRLQAAMAAWKAKGNARLADACAVALEAEQTKLKTRESA